MNRSNESFARATLRSFGIVVLAMFAAVAVRKLFLGTIGTHIIWVTFYPAVVMASFCGGWLAGLLCALASCLIALYGWPLFGDEPFLKDHWSWLGMVSFLINCAFISAMTEMVRHARLRAVQTAEQAKAAVKALEAENMERTRVEHQLRWKTAFLEAQVNSSVDAIVVVDPDRKLVIHNKHFIDLFKIPAHLAEDKDTEKRLRWIADMTTDPEQYLDQVHQAYAHLQEIRRDEIELKDGRILDRYTSPVVGIDGTYYGRIWTFRDITRRKKAELEIQRLAAFPRFNPNPVLELSATGEINYLNDSAEAIGRDLGLETPAQMLPSDFAAIVPECLALGTPILRVEKQIGSRVVSWSFFPIKFNNTVHCYGGDITERKRAVQKLALFRTLIERSHDGIHVVDPATGRFLDANESACQALGYTRDDLLTLTVLDVTVGIDRAAFEAANASIEKAGRTMIEALHRRKDGSTYPVEAGLSFVTLDRKYLVAIVRDITERKKTEKRLQESEGRMRAITDSAQDAIVMMDPEGLIAYWNPAAERIFGYIRGEAIGQNLHDLIVPARFHLAHHAAYPAFLETGRGAAMGKTLDLEACRKDGREISVQFSLSAVRMNDGWHAVGIIRDTTEQKSAEAEMEKIHRQLVESSRLAGMAEIATNVLHNVGNALNSINISTDLIANSVKKSRVASLGRVVALFQEHAHDLGAFITNDPGGRHVPDHLARLSEHLMAEQDKIAGELGSLRHNVEHIKDIVAMQQNYAKVGGVKEIIDLASLVEDSLRLNDDALKRHGVEVVRELEKVPLMNVDKHKILQILVNLVRNAKYACDESGRADGRLTVRMANADGWVRITVLDNGVGIPSENLTRIFNYGFTTRKGGHGFGLHGSALAAKDLGGSLTVCSGGPGQGAAFTLDLPCPTTDKSHE